MTSQACVFGNPIAQSRSPIIHHHFAKQFDIPLKYTKIAPSLSGFAPAVEQFFSCANAVGANVTLPFKEEAFQLADELSSHAKRASAVNTLINLNGTIRGDNTDGRGLIADLKYHGVDLANKSVLLLGAGGAAKGSLPAIIDAKPNSVYIYNRTPSKAKSLVDSTENYASCQVACFSGGDSEKAFDLIINATSLSLHDEVPSVPKSVFCENSIAYDMVYLDKPTSFMEFARHSGSQVQIDGLGMLIEQAALSFQQWFNEHPKTEGLRHQLRK
ncbi:shikimate dehydrogenase [Ningiella sp. W23]|uniref:shikimate dehydrogenase n=1 Tax=Ningiella sp. W23 TaxID=3023715 RepID=UPI00375838C8